MITTVASLALSAFLAGSCAAGIPASVTERETKYCGAGDFVQQSETISYSHILHQSRGDRLHRFHLYAYLSCNVLVERIALVRDYVPYAVRRE